METERGNTLNVEEGVPDMLDKEAWASADSRRRKHLGLSAAFTVPP